MSDTPILTKHAYERLKQRGLTHNQTLDVFQNPDRTIAGKKEGTIEFQKREGKSLITLIAAKNNKNEWIILSCWIDPPLPGSIDEKKHEEYKKFKKTSGWTKFWLILKQQLGF